MRTAAVLLLALESIAPRAAAAADLPVASAARFARLALDCVVKEYPNKIAHTLESDVDVRPPRELTPAFFGCYDWHSAVHGHWLLARLARTYPDAPFAKLARVALARSLTPERMAAEARYVLAKGRATFERPYGLAWLLQLSAELREWDEPEARRLSAALAPLESAVKSRLVDWLPKLAYPIREGEHNQTAFGFGLVLDYAAIAKDAELERLVRERSEALYLKDRVCPLSYEPSGQDFLSPCLAEADLMRRLLPKERFAAWLSDFLPQIPRGGPAAWLAPGVVTDPSDGKLAHLDGLNLSRAWMLDGIAAALPSGDARLPALTAAAEEHRRSGLASVTGAHYEGGHWLGTFAVYLVTGRGLPPSSSARTR
jgi:hypothetical protein